MPILLFLRWMGARVFFIVVVFFVGLLLAALTPVPDDIFAGDYKTATFQLCWALLALILYRPFLSWVDGKPADELAFNARSLPHFTQGCLISVAMLGVPIAVNTALGSFPMLYPTAKWLFVVVSVSLQAAIIEEIVFRGFLLQFLLKFLHPTICCLLVALTFMACHLDGRGSLSLMSVFLGGLMMTVAYFLTNSLWLPIGLHFGWDAVLFAVKYFPSVVPNSPRPFGRQALSEPVMLTIAVVVLAAMIGLLVYRLMNLSADNEREIQVPTAG